MTADQVAIREREERPVPRLVTDAQLREAVSGGTLVQKGAVTSVDGMKVNLHISERILKASYRQPVNISELPAAERAALAVDPGEVVFVLTE